MKNNEILDKQSSESQDSIRETAQKHYWRNLLIQYLLALIFVGGLEVFWIAPFDWRSFLWAAVLIGVLRTNSWFWRKCLPKKATIFVIVPFALYVLLPLHCVLWMFIIFPIKISKETTYVTKMLDSDPQRVDLLSVLEQQIIPDVPPEENA